MAWTDRERPVHLAVLAYLRLRFPRGLVVHVANGSSLRGPEVARWLAKATHMGAVKGWPDLMVLHDGETMLFEVKAEGGRLQPEQTAVHDRLAANGFRVAVVRSVQDVEECLADWNNNPALRRV